MSFIAIYAYLLTFDFNQDISHSFNMVFVYLGSG